MAGKKMIRIRLKGYWPAPYGTGKEFFADPKAAQTLVDRKWAKVVED